MNTDSLCFTCEAINYWTEWLIWDEAGKLIWEGWPEDMDADPPAAKEWHDAEPEPHQAWMQAATQYEPQGLQDAVTFMACAVHGIPGLNA